MSVPELEKEKNLMTPERKITRAARHPEEPCAGKPHAGICEGAPGNRWTYLNA